MQPKAAKERGNWPKSEWKAARIGQREVVASVWTSRKSFHTCLPANWVQLFEWTRKPGGWEFRLILRSGTQSGGSKFN